MWKRCAAHWRPRRICLRVSDRVLSATLSAMYQDRLLAEYRAPQNRRSLADSNGQAEKKNPMCGDAIAVMVRVVDDRIIDVSFTGTGCSIAVASASLMTQSVRGLRSAEALHLMASVEAMLASGGSRGGSSGGAAGGARVGGAVETLPDVLAPLRGVAPFAARHGCALMPWQAFSEAMRNAARASSPEPVVVARTFR